MRVVGFKFKFTCCTGMRCAVKCERHSYRCVLADLSRYSLKYFYMGNPTFTHEFCQHLQAIVQSLIFPNLVQDRPGVNAVLLH